MGSMYIVCYTSSDGKQLTECFLDFDAAMAFKNENDPTAWIIDFFGSPGAAVVVDEESFGDNTGQKSTQTTDTSSETQPN